jgi:hypothetical protein
MMCIKACARSDPAFLRYASFSLVPRGIKSKNNNGQQQWITISKYTIESSAPKM